LDFSKLKKVLGVKVKSEGKFLEAFTHKSFTNENRRSGVQCNERLEFLGDAVVELLTSDFLFKKFPRQPEGKLTALRSALVCGENLAKIARALGLGEFLFLSKGESRAGGAQKNYILANTFEAVVGAIFLDSGLGECQKFLEKNLFVSLDEILRKKLHRDAKSLLQEIAQEKRQVTPHFQLIGSRGPDHDKTFQMGAFIGQEQVGTGKGSSKQKAETAAAENALRNLGWGA